VVADLDVVAHPRHIEHLPGEAVGRCEHQYFGAVPVDLAAKLLDQAKALAVEVLDLGEIDHDSGPALDGALELLVQLVGVREIDFTA
jgi:hypothetical protein